MPNAINPDDYNIDYFSSGFLGITTVGDFREYLLGNNLQDLPPELITGAAGNFTDDFSERGVEKDINYAPITNPGSIDEWNLAGNFEVSLFDVSYQNPSQNVGTNQYGPPTIQPYNEPGLVPEETGFIQYPTSSGGDDFKALLKENLLSDQLNLGPGTAINFPSPLNDIAKERRKEEAENKLKLKAENQILGKLNLDPFGLLAGQDLILRDYDITTRPTTGGKILEFTTDAIGLEIPVSPIPDGAFGKWGDKDGPETYEDLLNSTGAGTKSLIFNSVGRNKYGPYLQEPKGKAANTFGAGQAPQLSTYLDDPNDPKKIDSPIPGEEEEKQAKPLVDRINQRVGKIVENIAGQAGIGVPPDDLTPKEFENPSVTTDDLVKNSELGFDELPNDLLGTDTWDVPGTSAIEITDEGNIVFDRGPVGTAIPLDVDPKFYPGTIPAGTENDGKPFRRGMYWGEQNSNPFRRGLLKYTQDLVNNSRNNGQKDKARFIGVVNDDTNFDAKTGRHNKYSMGNTIFGGTGSDTFYCRSWSVRNPYRKVKDLIRHGSNVEGTDDYNPLTRPDFGLSVLDDNGFVKVAPYAEVDENGLKGLNVGNPAIQKYMLSIENLAWQNTDHLLRVPPCEVGPNGGRIMWFPPYDISFTDNSSVNWDSTQIIGRGEPIYTYNSTERTGTLAFKIVVDHSTDMAAINGLGGLQKQGEQALFKYFAGCEYPIEKAIPILPVTDIEEIKIAAVKETKIIPKKEIPNPPAPPGPITFYFRNAYRFDRDTIGTTLETELTPPSPERSPNYPSNWYRKNPNGYLRGSLPSVPPVIPLFVPGIGSVVVPNPAFSGDVAANYSQQVNDTRNEQALNALNDMVDFLLTPSGKRFKIKIVGRTSDAGVSPNNKKLGQKRAETTKAYMLKLLKEKEIGVGAIKALELGSQRDFPSEKTWEDNPIRWNTTTTGEDEASLSIQIDPETGERTEFRDEGQTGDGLIPNVTVPEAIADRNTTITLEYNPEIDDLFTIDNVDKEIEIELEPERTETKTTVRGPNELTADEIESQQREGLAKALAERATRYMAWECSYFQKMKQEDSFIYETLSEKLDYFHPAFHSMTPEGFNSRLTFLKQCTRQGPNIGPNTGADAEPSNLSFGKPPICVLRVGDFYHTKIVIDSVNLTFDPLQWDLNPEGIGVQPMLCSVDLNFKFIGGSSLGGPISQLQNAVGFNFFANTGLYNPRTIYSSVQQDENVKPDASTGLPAEDPDNTVNNTTTPRTYGFGAYIKPNQILNASGEFENEPQPPIPPAPEENVKKAQIEDEGIIEQKTDGFTDEEKKAIEDQFNKKAEQRAGVFKIKIAEVDASTFKNGRIGVSKRNLCAKEQYTKKLLYVSSDQESITKIKIKFPDGTEKTYNNPSETGTRAAPRLFANGSDPKRYFAPIWDGTDNTKGILGKKENGVQAGVYGITAYAEIESTLEEEGTTELKKEIETPTITFNVSCCDKAGTTKLTDIPEAGLC